MWKDCIGTFLETLGAERFFKALPLRLLEVDMHSLTYAYDSRSYLIQITQSHLRKGDLAFFISYFLPIINGLDK